MCLRCGFKESRFEPTNVGLFLYTFFTTVGAFLSPGNPLLFSMDFLLWRKQQDAMAWQRNKPKPWQRNKPKPWQARNLQ